MKVPLPGPVLVVGCGSIGHRHTRNLRGLGVNEIIAYDAIPARSERLANEQGVKTVRDLSELKTVYAAFICAPPSFHVTTALTALELGAHLFIEKPISDTLDGVDRLLERAESLKRSIMVGFNLRFHPCLQHIKAQLEEGVIGRALGMRIQFGQYLPDWHPWEDYRKGYSANRELGGGVILDRVHELDYARWFLGEVCEVTCVAGKLSQLEIDTEDFAEVLLKFASGAVAEIHLDYIQRPYASSCQIIGEGGTILWDYGARHVRCFSAPTGTWQEWPEPRGFDINQTYADEVRTFLEVLEGQCIPPVDGHEGRRISQLALAAKQSAAEGRTIHL